MNLIRISTNSIESEQQKTLTKEITDLKNRLQRLEADNLSLQQEVKSFIRIKIEINETLFD